MNFSPINIIGIIAITIAFIAMSLLYVHITYEKIRFSNGHGKQKYRDEHNLYIDSLRQKVSLWGILLAVGVLLIVIGHIMNL